MEFFQGLSVSARNYRRVFVPLLLILFLLLPSLLFLLAAVASNSAAARYSPMKPICRGLRAFATRRYELMLPFHDWICASQR